MSRLFSLALLGTAACASGLVGCPRESAQGNRSRLPPRRSNPNRGRLPVPESTPPGEPLSEVAIEKALASPTQVDFVETPLQDVIDYLKDYHRIEIQIDTKALNDVGIDPTTPITKNLKGISLRSALKLMLRELELTYVIQDEVLLITTPEEAEIAFDHEGLPGGRPGCVPEQQGRTLGRL